MELWNKRDIQVPPNCSVKMKSSDIDIINLKSIFNDALKMFEGKHILHREAALLSRYLYKAQRRMRGHKGFMFLDKVNRGLKRYVSLDLENVYRNFSMMLSFEGCEEWVYVPAKQMLQYVLIRTLGFCKVMSYLSTACQNAAFYHRGVLTLGHLINQNLLCLGIISRIWYCTRYFMICACQWYTKLLPFVTKLQISGLYLLPTEFEFPLDLKTWLEPYPLSVGIRYEADMQKVTQDIYEEFKDVGKPVDRKDFLAKKNKMVSMPPQNERIGFTPRNGPLRAELKLKQTIDELFDIKPPKDDLGEPLSCDRLLLQTTQNERVPETINVFTHDDAKLVKTSVDITPKSKTLKLFMTTTSDLCSNSYNDSAGDSRELISDNQSFKTMRENNTISTNKFVNVNNGKNRKMVLKTALQPSSVHELTTVNGSKKALCKTNSNEGVINNNQEIYLFKNLLSPKTSVSATSLSNDAKVLPGGGEYKSPLHIGATRKNDVQKNKVQILSYENQVQYDTMQNKSGNEAKTSPTSKDQQNTKIVFRLDSNIEQISVDSEDRGQCVIAPKSLPKKNKKSLDKWEIINGLRTVNNVKEFLHSEKRARAKGKRCVTSELNNTEWTVLVDAINKFLKKCSITKPKGNKKIKSVIGEIRNTLISFVI